MLEKITIKIIEYFKNNISKAIIFILVFPFIIMIILKVIFWCGYIINLVTGINLLTLDLGMAISLGDYYYIYSQLLLAFATIILSGVLVFYASRDYKEEYLSDFRVEFEISNIGYFVADKSELFLHLPITLVNRSRKSGWISDVSVEIFDGNKKITELGASFFVNIKNNYFITQYQNKFTVDNHTGSYNDGLPFTNIPLKSEEVLRELITLKQLNKNSPYNLFSKGKKYKMKVELYIDGIKTPHKKNIYIFEVNNDLWTTIKNSYDQKVPSNRETFKLEKIS